MDSIQQLAAELPECFGEGALTRSGYTKSVADLFPLNDILRSSATKSGKTDDAEVTKNIYVVNYADDGGFAILAADTLMETILAYSDQGNITDTMDNPGVRMFMEMIPGYAAAQLEHGRQIPGAIGDSFEAGVYTGRAVRSGTVESNRTF